MSGETNNKFKRYGECSKRYKGGVLECSARIGGCARMVVLVSDSIGVKLLRGPGNSLSERRKNNGKMKSEPHGNRV